MIFILPFAQEKAVCPQCLKVVSIPTGSEFTEFSLDRPERKVSTAPKPYPHGRQPFGPHRRTGEPPGCVSWVAVSIVLLLVVAGTWPFSLWLILLGIAVYLVIAVKVRRSILSIFLDSDLPPSLENARRRTIVITSVIAAICTYSCAYSSSDPNILPWWFLAAALWSVVIHLSVHQLSKAKEKRRLAFALLKSLRELILTVTIVFGLYSVAAVFIGQLPLDNTSLFQLRQWELDISSIHVFLKALKFSALQLFLLFVALISLRVVDRQFGDDNAMVDRVGKWLKFSLTSIERLSLAFLIAASLTFLGTHAAGLPARISAQIKDANRQYLELQRSVQSESVSAIRQEILKKAWNERPPIVRAEMKLSQNLISTREDYESLQNKVRNRLALASTAVEATILPGPPNKSEPQSLQISSAPDSVSPAQIQAVLSEAQTSSQAPREISTEKNETPEDELLKKTLNELSPADRLTDNIASLAAIKESFPVFGEFISACSSALGDVAFARFRDSAFVRALHAKFMFPSRPLSELIRQEAVEVVQQTTLDWSSYSTAWSGRVTADIGRRKQRLTIARRNLVAAAARAQIEAMARYSHEIHEQEVLLGRLGLVLNDQSIVAAAHQIGQDSSLLLEFSPVWPATGEASVAQKAAFDRIARSIDFGPRLEFEGYEFGDGHLYPVRRNPLDPPRPNKYVPEDPLDAMESVSRRCNSLIVDIVGKSLSSSTKDAVNETLGSKFSEYKFEWTQREFERKQQVEKQNEARRQEAIQRNEERQRREMERYRVEERMREVERPVE